MKSTFRSSFNRDLRKIKNSRIKKRVAVAIEEVEAAETLADISNLKKLQNSDNSYRIRVGDYRLGIVVKNDVVDFVRCLHRRELYRFFP